MVFGVSDSSIEVWVIRYMLVVIMVVVWIRVDIGVGLVMVLGNYMNRGNWVFLL